MNETTNRMKRAAAFFLTARLHRARVTGAESKFLSGGMNLAFFPCALVLFLCAAHSAQAAPTVALNAPVMLLRGATGQFAKITPITEPGYTIQWSLTNGVIVSGQGTDLVVFNVSPSAALAVLTATVSNGVDSASASQTILLNSSGGSITDGSQTVTLGGTNRLQFSLLQQLRGERVSVTASPGVQCTLLDAQGRLYAAGESIDFRVPVRGSSFLVFSAATTGSYTFTLLGVRPLTNTGGVDSGVERGTGNTAARGRTTNVHTYSGMTTGEAMTLCNGQVVSAIYDHTLRRTRIVALPAGNAPGWEWISSDDAYVRTLSTGQDGNIYGVGSGGGAGPAADTIYACKLLPDGTRVWEVNLQTSGDFYDYGYGIVADAGGRVVVSGFTTGSVTATPNAGALDAFAIGLNASGSPRWTRRYATTGDDRVYASVVSSAGDVVLFGDTSGLIGTADTTLGALGARDLFLIALDFDGNPRWTRQFGSAEVELAFDLENGPGGDLYLTGMASGALDSAVSDPLNPDVFLIRCAAATGAPVWARQLGAAEGQSGETLFADAAGVHVLFYTNGSFPGATNDSRGTRASDDMVIARYDANGRLLWVQQFDDTSERIFARALVVQAGTIYVLRDHVYVPGGPFTTATIDQLPVPGVRVTGVPVVAPGAMQIEVTGIAGQVFDAEDSADLAIWNPSGSFAIAPDGSPLTVAIPFPPGAPRWFARFKSP
jgi:hypothetical protein